METSRLLTLIDDFENALAEHDMDRALASLAILEELDPADPAWPKRRAEIYRQRGDDESELNALLSVASLQVDAGLVARAMASCKRILALSPGHPSTEQMLSLLYEMPSPGSGQNADPEIAASPAIDLSKVAQASSEASIQEIVLTEAIPDSRAVTLADLGASSAAVEISLGNDGDEELDLFLDDVADEDAEEDFVAMPHLGPDETQSQILIGSLFRSIGPQGAQALFRDAEIVDFPAGVPVFSQGDSSDCLYVVLEGAVVPISEEQNGMRGGIRFGVIESGDFFGEIGLLTDQPRNATIRTLVETRLLEIDRKTVWKLLSTHQEALTLLLRTSRLRLVDRLVRTHPLFNLFGRAKRSLLAKQFKLLETRDGAIVIQQGLMDQGLYVVLAGQLDIVESGVDGEKTVATAGHGDVLGEFSELFRQVARASVIARGKCWLLTLSHARLASIMKANPRLSELLHQLAHKRDRQRREI